jgi:PadR family transcriptional regulator PadR
MDFDREFLTGTLTTLILALLSERPHYAYEILYEAERRSDRHFELKVGTLYPALHQMERSGWLASEWRESHAGRPRKYYRLTATGRRKAKSKREQWEAITAAMHAILEGSHG